MKLRRCHHLNQQASGDERRLRTPTLVSGNRAIISLGPQGNDPAQNRNAKDYGAVEDVGDGQMKPPIPIAEYNFGKQKAKDRRAEERVKIGPLVGDQRGQVADHEGRDIHSMGDRATDGHVCVCGYGGDDPRCDWFDIE